MEIRPLDIAEMTAVDTTSPRKPSCSAPRPSASSREVVGGFFDRSDDDTPERLGIALAASSDSA